MSLIWALEYRLCVDHTAMLAAIKAMPPLKPYFDLAEEPLAVAQREPATAKKAIMNINLLNSDRNTGDYGKMTKKFL